MALHQYGEGYVVAVMADDGVVELLSGLPGRRMAPRWLRFQRVVLKWEIILMRALLLKDLYTRFNLILYGYQ